MISIVFCWVYAPPDRDNRFISCLLSAKTSMSAIRVAFDDRTYVLEDVLENGARYVRQLERARKTPGWAECQCAQHDTPLRLVIRRYGSMYHLAGWPDDGHRHAKATPTAKACPFYKDGSAVTTKAAPADAAIRKTAAGLNTRLDVVFAPASTAAGPVKPTTPDAAGERKSRQTASLLAFLQSLWSEASLNVWPAGGGTRNWGFCSTALVEAIGDGPINGQQADRVLHVMRRFEADQSKAINDELDQFIAALAPVGEAAPSRRALVLGEINEIGPSKYGHTITLRQSRRRYYTDNRLLDKVAASYRFAYAAIGEKQARVVTLMLVELKNGYARVVDACLMLCSATFLPCDSSFEVAMANRLTREGRAFEKPLSPNADGILPDFVLTDTPQAVEIEVYGLNGLAEYEKRKREKQAMRAKKGVDSVEWNTDREPLDAVVFPSTHAR
ncbi:DUF1173 family protein [Paraburkholderia sp.]